MLCLGWLAILQGSTVYLYVNNGCVDLIYKIENAVKLIKELIGMKLRFSGR